MKKEKLEDELQNIKILTGLYWNGPHINKY